MPDLFCYEKKWHSIGSAHCHPVLWRNTCRHTARAWSGGYKGALEKINLDRNWLIEVYMGAVLQANMGQAPCPAGSPFRRAP